MKKILLLLLFTAFFLNVFSQSYQPIYQYGLQWERGKFDTTLSIPTGNGAPAAISGTHTQSAVYYDSLGKSFYVYSPHDNAWYPVSGSGTQPIYPTIVVDYTNTPPSAPNDGDRYLAGSAPTGVWSGYPNYFMTYSSSTGLWTPTIYTNGQFAETKAGVVYQYQPSAWNIQTIFIKDGGQIAGNLSFGSNDNSSVIVKQNGASRIILDTLGNISIVAAGGSIYAVNSDGSVRITSPGGLYGMSLTPTSGQFLTVNPSTHQFYFATPAGTGGGTVNSVGLTMPTAFNVASSPVTSSGIIAVTGAGTTSQYIRGDGTLATFPAIPANLNFANTDLNFTGNRIHHLKHFDLTLDSARTMNFTAYGNSDDVDGAISFTAKDTVLGVSTRFYMSSGQVTIGTNNFVVNNGAYFQLYAAQENSFLQAQNTAGNQFQLGVDTTKSFIGIPGSSTSLNIYKDSAFYESRDGLNKALFPRRAFGYDSLVLWQDLLAHSGNYNLPYNENANNYLGGDSALHALDSAHITGFHTQGYYDSRYLYGTYSGPNFTTGAANVYIPGTINAGAMQITGTGGSTINNSLTIGGALSVGGTTTLTGVASGTIVSGGYLGLDASNNIVKSTAGSGGGGTTTNTVTFNNSGSGASSGTTFDGSAAKTISYNTLGAAPISSPALTGTPTAPTATSGTNTTQLATTAFVQAAVAGGGGLTAANFITSEVPSGTINGTNTTFTLANTPTAGTVRLFRNGIRTTAFTVSGGTLTISPAPLTSDTLLTDYMK